MYRRHLFRKPLPDESFLVGRAIGANTNLEEFQPTEIDGDGIVTFTIDKLDLVEGTYRLDLAAHKTDGYPYDYHRLMYTFRVKSRIRDVGIYRPDHNWSFGGNIKFSAK